EEALQRCEREFQVLWFALANDEAGIDDLVGADTEHPHPGQHRRGAEKGTAIEVTVISPSAHGTVPHRGSRIENRESRIEDRGSRIEASCHARRKAAKETAPSCLA